MMFPKIVPIFFKTILDTAMKRFFREFDSSFCKNEDGQYVFSNSMSESSLEKLFIGYVTDELSSMIGNYSESRPEFIMVIGSCVPGQNIMLHQLKDDAKLTKLTDVVPDLRYFLRETDIKLNIRMFNSVFESIFSKFMKKKPKAWRNVFFIRHSMIDCNTLLDILRKRYGSLVENPSKPKDAEAKSCIFTLNDDIYKKVHRNREKMNGISSELEPIYDEICHFVDSCINGDF